MSQRLSTAQKFDPSPVTRGRRGDRMPIRVRSLGSLQGSEIDRRLRRGLISSNSSSSSESLIVSRMPQFQPGFVKLNYEDVFIGSSKQPRIQNKIYSDEEINAVQDTESKNKKTKELVDIIKEALGTKKKPRQIKKRVEERQIPGVIYTRNNSTASKEIWTTKDINNYRMKK